ncbi:hypothetical protein MSG28_000540 [Choristoneura fumiferana]|uniref:Uncharacterized protein n=1 Tax=Choristoneura fumiferana TaxID=7141 RepID=A0ACC0K177_CHOFU|nr:hypothetical protein MSG28_000540 [Choristoneura fumiferana]
MVKQFQQVKDNPVPKALFYTCMDSRMIPTRFTETSVGDMFVVRNAGNLIPHSQHFIDEMTSCEPAALELACIVNDIRHIIVCGHSDCKAMNLLYTLKSKEESSTEQRRISPLKSWLCNHGKTSLDKFIAMNGDFSNPISMANSRPIFNYNDESQAEKLARKSKDSPFMIIGILGLIGVCGVGAYQFKRRGKMSTSVFLMQLRVAAQGTVVSALTIGIAYSLAKQHLFKDEKKDK